MHSGGLSCGISDDSLDTIMSLNDGHLYSAYYDSTLEPDINLYPIDTDTFEIVILIPDGSMVVSDTFVLPGE